MPIKNINGVDIYYEYSAGHGEPLVLVHGSWVDHNEWNPVVNELSKTFRVLVYDRRGHSQSERSNRQGSTEEDVDDLVGLIEEFGMAPAHVAANSFGASIALKAAARRPDLFRSLNVHEPPLFDLIRQLPEEKPLVKRIDDSVKIVGELISKGQMEAAATQFVETIAVGPGGWQKLPPPIREIFIFNAPTFLDELHDSQALQVDTSLLSSFRAPVLLTHGSESPPFFVLVLDQLAKAMPDALRQVFNGSGHVPHISDQQGFIGAVKKFCLGKD